MVDGYSDRLGHAMEAAGMDVASMAREMGVSYQAVRKAVDGGKFGTDNNSKAASILKVSSDWLATGKGPRKTLAVAPSVQMDAIQGDGAIGPECQILQYSTGGSMGAGLLLKDQPGVIRAWNVSREWVEKNVPYYTKLENLAIVTGFGDSMLGMFNPGDPLLVDRGITRADVDGVYFFRVGEEGYIKRLQRIPGEGILVISENQKYRDWTIKPGMDFEVMGKVLKAWNGQAL